MARTYRTHLGTDWYGDPRFVVEVRPRYGVTLTHDTGWLETWNRHLKDERRRSNRAAKRRIRAGLDEG